MRSFAMTLAAVGFAMVLVGSTDLATVLSALRAPTRRPSDLVCAQNAEYGQLCAILDFQAWL